MILSSSFSYYSDAMDLPTCRYLLFAAFITLVLSHKTKAGEDITYCCDTSDGCCGADWGLHCCNFAAKICCYGEERVHSIRHHNHRHWGWDSHWIKVLVYFIFFTFIITGLLLCCTGRRRQSRNVIDYTVLPGYEYPTTHPSYPTAQVQQNFPVDEYPLIDYRTGQPQGHSLNSNQRTPPPPYYNMA